jgi:hypothetical protein
MSRRNGLLYIVVVVPILLGSAGCSGDQGASAAPVERKKPAVPRREAVVTEPSGPYQVVAVSEPGSITGTVQVAPGVTPAQVSVPENLPSGCTAPDRNADLASSGAVRDAVVWLTDIRTGKRFPTEKLFDLVNENCLIAPKVQPVFAGATLNVGSNDGVLHHNRFINVATGESEAVAPFNDKGEIIPYDRLLTKTAQYEVVCDVHPWTHGWLVVVDHPYFAQTSAGGAFTIDGVPPGTYRIRAWHPSFGIADGTVTVAAGAPAAANLTFGPKAAAQPPAPASGS